MYGHSYVLILLCISVIDIWLLDCCPLLGVALVHVMMLALVLALTLSMSLC